MITCRELIDFIDSYLDRELPDPARESFERHLKVCPSCVAYLDGYRTTVALSRGAASQPEDLAAAMPAELVAAILDARRKDG